MPKLMLPDAMRRIILFLLVSGTQCVCAEHLLQEAQTTPCVVPTIEGSIGIAMPNPPPPPERKDPSPCEPRQTPARSTAPPPRLPPGFVANDRIELVAPNHKLTLAKENEIALVIRGQGLLEVSSAQGQNLNIGTNPNVPREAVEGSRNEHVPVLRHPDGTAYIKLIPMRLGNVELFVSGIFPDRGMFSKSLAIEVEPPARKPTQVEVGRFVVLNLAAEHRAHLEINAIYDGIHVPIRIDPSYARFVVRTSGKLPVADLDESKGLLTPVNPGHALVETWFGGQKKLTCVIVKKIAQDFQPGCEDLLASGETLR